ncbi:MAG: hypothetical protein U9R00_01835 [Patescibacteria group bacterium]|nr:hypothetical protein [Patescibacteria group bacterium]
MKFFNRKEKMPQPKVAEKEVLEEEKYEPELGEANRYKNALVRNEDLAKEINEKAKVKAEEALSLLADMFEKNPEKLKGALYSDQVGSQWNLLKRIENLKRIESEIRALYGVTTMETLARFASTKPPIEPVKFERVLKALVFQVERYEPKLGEANRYENALVRNKDLAKEINEKAKVKAEEALSLLALSKNALSLGLKHSPEKVKNFFSQLQKREKEILDLYGVTGMEMLERHASTKPPKETLEFEQRLKTFMREQNYKTFIREQNPKG